MAAINNAIQFFKEAYVELTKVTWLGKKEVIATTIVVVVFIIILALFVSFVDVILSGILGTILNLR
ncbi:MAG: preprotein translocase subunit SecE [Endomicrobiaceae bacterium]|nr:preprotein translocase subunit SecE [Endomicrobiaceae bacterium]MDD3053847.1 preprotein translocase subunit SecE [Endomicrobiaceae bacterium]MDD3922915.1 preprotein translocase subunit SecE [Endomicrobiaceae bacterium]MDD5102065.1 preprotein translocase subunit SecE [Endomicrobiaceae bacterium]